MFASEKSASEFDCHKSPKSSDLAAKALEISTIKDKVENWSDVVMRLNQKKNDADTSDSITF